MGALTAGPAAEYSASKAMDGALKGLAATARQSSWAGVMMQRSPLAAIHAGSQVKGVLTV